MWSLPVVSVAAKTLFPGCSYWSQSFCLPPQCKHMWTLGRRKHILAKLWFTLITGLQMLQILSERKNITWGGILRNFQLSGETAAGPAPGTAGSGYVGEHRRKSWCLWSAATVSMLSLTLFEMKLQTKVKLAFLLLSALVEKDNTSLSDYTGGKKKITDCGFKCLPSL